MRVVHHPPPPPPPPPPPDEPPPPPPELEPGAVEADAIALLNEEPRPEENRATSRVLQLSPRYQFGE